jgi:hypothetical protein
MEGNLELRNCYFNWAAGTDVRSRSRVIQWSRSLEDRANRTCQRNICGNLSPHISAVSHLNAPFAVGDLGIVRTDSHDSVWHISCISRT